MDAWLIAAVRAEVHTLCRDGRIERVGQPRPEDIVLQVHTARGTFRLLMSANPSLPRAHLIDGRPPNPPSPPAFCQGLRRRIEGARVIGCRQPGMERVLELLLQARDELGNPRPLRLIAELTGRLANLLLVGPDDRVIDTLRRVTEEVNRRRQVLPGLPYQPPPRPDDRLDPVLTLSDLGSSACGVRLRQALAATPPELPTEQRLARCLFGFSPSLSSAVAAWAREPHPNPSEPVLADAHDPRPPLWAPPAFVEAAHVGPAAGEPATAPGPDTAADPSSYPLPPPGAPPAMAGITPPPQRDGAGVSEEPAGGTAAPTATATAAPAPGDAAVATAVVAVAQSILDRSFRPCVLTSGTRILPSAWPLPGWTAQPAASASEACARAYHELAAALQARALHQQMASVLRAARARVERRLGKQEEELAQASDADSLRVAGELLLAYGHTVPRGAAEADLPSFEDPSRTVRVALDPSLSAAANGQRMLRKYQKERRARAQVEAHVAASREELRYLEEAWLWLDQAEDTSELRTLQAELAAQGVFTRRGGDRRNATRRAPGRRPGKQPAPPTAAAAPPPLLRFAADGEWVVLVGKSAAANDHLTMRIARPDDVWLHARQTPGSHVLLRPPAAGPGRGTPSDEALLQAARCAAHFSAGRGASRVAVDYTQRRHVWKPAGARPGFVLYRNERTLAVEPGDLPPRMDPPPSEVADPAPGGR